MRRFVPFGTHWAMGIDVPYSFGVIDDGAFWSCGQCPLDLDVNVRAPGDLEAQLRIVAGYIRDQFTPFGLPPSRIEKLVAYIVGGENDHEMTRRVLEEALGVAPLVITLGVPHFYYPGMRVEIDVYAVVEGAVGEFAHRVAMSDTELGQTDHLLTARLYASPSAKGAAIRWSDIAARRCGVAWQQLC